MSLKYFHNKNITLLRAPKREERPWEHVCNSMIVIAPCNNAYNEDKWYRNNCKKLQATFNTMTCVSQVQKIKVAWKEQLLVMVECLEYK